MLCLSGFELYSRWVPLIFLHYFILLCNAQIGSQALVSLLFAPLGGLRLNSSQNCHPCTFILQS